MADDNSAMIAAGGVLGGSVLAVFGTWLTGRFRSKEVTEQTLAQTVDAKLKTLMAGYEKRIEDLTDQVNVQDKHIGLLTRHILTLTKLLSKTGIIVPPMPSLDEAPYEDDLASL